MHSQHFFLAASHVALPSAHFCSAQASPAIWPAMSQIFFAFSQIEVFNVQLCLQLSLCPFGCSQLGAVGATGVPPPLALGCGSAPVWLHTSSHAFGTL